MRLAATWRPALQPALGAQPAAQPRQEAARLVKFVEPQRFQFQAQALKPWKPLRPASFGRESDHPRGEIGKSADGFGRAAAEGGGRSPSRRTDESGRA
jgi:hypothetical protein